MEQWGKVFGWTQAPHLGGTTIPSQLALAPSRSSFAHYSSWAPLKWILVSTCSWRQAAFAACFWLVQIWGPDSCIKLYLAKCFCVFWGAQGCQVCGIFGPSLRN